MTQTQGDTSSNDPNAADLEKPTFEQEFELDHAVERVWEALTESEALAQWLFPNDMVPTEGARFGFDLTAENGPGDRIDCEVRHVDPYRSISYTWNVYGTTEEGLVTFDLHATPSGGTRLRIHHAQCARASLSPAGTAAGLRYVLHIQEKHPIALGTITMALAA